MDFLRKCLAILLTIALAAYGIAATASAHAHAYSGFHGVHAIDDHHHDGAVAHHADDIDRHDSQPAPEDPLSPVSEHHESGFHSHAAPQFGPVDASIAIALALRSRRIDVFDPDDLAATARDESPFKPPRSFL